MNWSDTLSTPSQVEAIFFAALDRETATERASYLDQACGVDATLRRRVERLLDAHPRATDFLARPAVERHAVEPLAADSQTPTFRMDSAGHSEHDDDVSDDDIGDALAFLSPTRRSDSLGRIGHYEVLEVLGRGGFGIVFRAFDVRLQRVVAIKVLAPHLAATSPARKRFLREARSSAMIRHENVVQVYAVDEQPLPYLVMEFIPGETLQQRLNRKGPLESLEVVQIGRQIAEGLAAAHESGLIHRDIKPANILVETTDEAGRMKDENERKRESFNSGSSFSPHPSSFPKVKITDFGLARAADDASLTQSGNIAGTPSFMAPEQALGEALDHRTDLFSLGSVLYTMCSGRPPFRAKSSIAALKRVAEDTPRPIAEIIPEVPSWLCEIIARLHAKKPEDRISTAREVVDLLGRGLAEMQGPGSAPWAPATAPVMIEKRPPEDAQQSAPAVGGRRFRNNPWAIATAVLLTLIAGLGFTEASGITDFRATVIRLFSPEGTLVVEVDDPAVSVLIDGSEIVITGAGAREIRLKPGRYTVEASKEGKVVSRELINVTNNGRQVVRVSQEASTNDSREKSLGAQTEDPDRRAAEYVLYIGGTVGINDQSHQISVAADLPPELFRLTQVDLRDNKHLVNDSGLVSFKECRHLTHLNLWGSKVTDAGLANFKDCRDLTVLQLLSSKVTDAGLAHFKDCHNLAFLDLNWTHVTDAGVANFKDCKKLTSLSLAHTKVTDAGLAYFRDCENLAALALGDIPITDAGLVQLKHCTNLTTVNLDGTQISDAGVAQFKDCKKLTSLLLYNNRRVSDEGLAHLQDCRNLTSLAVQNTKVTAAGVAALQTALPNCKIDWDVSAINAK